uniref:NADH-ubiquinone oxidoreductase chain 4 n=1 Tax=Plotocnide borealis TaxID=1755686 RepID=A0A0S2IAM2_9CNID|nr:NADH dehydrogenase subunit 4 [Plotocnide borealis]
MFFFLIFTPLLAIFHIFILKRYNQIKLWKIALWWSFLLWCIYLIFVLFIKNDINFQFITIIKYSPYFSLLSSWGNIMFSLDGISIFFIGLSILLIPICILISSKTITYFQKEFLMLLFLIIFFLINVFSTLDIISFYIFFESILIPIFIMIGVWGSREEKIKAAFYFFFYTLIGSLLMLLSIFKLYALTGTINYENLIYINISNNDQFWLFLGFFASLSVKIPMIPFHLWLPQAHVEAPIAGSVLLAGILLKLGGYGFLRFSFTIFPNASEFFSPIIIILSLIAIIYGAFTTCRQIDLKRLIAYSSVSHMGLVTMAIFCHSIEGIIGSIIMMIAHGLISSGLFMSTSIIYWRHSSRIIKYYRGLNSTMPLFSLITFILILGNVSFPLTLNFIAEFISIAAAINYSFIVGFFCCLGAFIGIIYSLYMFNRIFFGVITPHLYGSRDLLFFEFQSFLPLIFFTLLLGIVPNIIVYFLHYSSFIIISL